MELKNGFKILMDGVSIKPGTILEPSEPSPPDFHSTPLDPGTPSNLTNIHNILVSGQGTTHSDNPKDIRWREQTKNIS